MRSRDEACRILEGALRTASASVDEAEVALCGGSAGWVSMAGNRVHPSQQLAVEAVAVRVWRGGRTARAVVADVHTRSIEEAARRALAALPAGKNPVAPEVVPPPQVYTEVEAFDPATARLHPLDRMALVGQAIMTGHARGMHAGGRVAAGQGGLLEDGSLVPYAVANTRGLLAYHASTWARFDAVLVGRERRGLCSVRSHALGRLDASECIERAAWMAAAGRAHTLAPGRYPAVLGPAAVASLVRRFGEGASVRRVGTEESYLSSLFELDPRVDIYDDPLHELHRGAPFDVAGVARGRHPLIRAGRPGQPLVGRAEEGGPPPTGHLELGADGRPRVRARHLVMNGGEEDVESLVRSTPVGVYVARFEGLRTLDAKRLRVAACTDGLFAIRGGEMAEPLADMRLDLSVLDLFTRLDGLGRPVWADDAVVPPVRVADFPLYAWT